MSNNRSMNIDSKSNELFTPTNPGYVSQTGSNVGVSNQQVSSTPTILANGSENIQFTAPAKTLARITNLQIQIPAPVGATSGNHTVDIYYQIPAGNHNMIRLTGTFSQAITLQFGLQSGTSIPSSFSDLLNIIGNILFSDTLSINLFYQNATNVSQTGSRNYSIMSRTEGHT